MCLGPTSVVNKLGSMEAEGDQGTVQNSMKLLAL